MAKVGDKFIIEIGEVFTAKGTYMAYGCEENEYEENLYRIKWFNSLVFDDNGLNRLEKYYELPSKEIVVGDEVAIPDGRKFVATYVSKTDNYVAGLDPSGNIVGTPLGSCVKTGRAHNFLADAVRSLKE